MSEVLTELAGLACDVRNVEDLNVLRIRAKDNVGLLRSLAETPRQVLGQHHSSTALLEFIHEMNTRTGANLAPFVVIALTIQHAHCPAEARASWLCEVATLFYGGGNKHNTPLCFRTYHKDVAALVLAYADHSILAAQARQAVAPLHEAVLLSRPAVSTAASRGRDRDRGRERDSHNLKGSSNMDGNAKANGFDSHAGRDSVNDSCLTAAHVALVRVCAAARMYKFAVDFMQSQSPIFSIDPASAHITPKHYLSYFYHCALCYIGTKAYGPALECLNNYITIPSVVPSAISLLAYRTAKLVSLHHCGEPYQMPKHTSSYVKAALPSPSMASVGAAAGVAAGAPAVPAAAAAAAAAGGIGVASGFGTYVRLEESFLRGDSSVLLIAVDSNREALEADGNYGLALALKGAQTRRKMRQLTDTYITLSIEDMASKLDIGSAGEAEKMLSGLIASGQIAARIDQTTGMVYFQDAHVDDEEKEREMVQCLEQTMALTEKIELMKKQLYSSPAYLKSLTTSGGASGGGDGGSSGRGIFDAMETDVLGDL